MIVRTNILDFMIGSGLKPVKIVLPKEQWDSLLFQLSSRQRVHDSEIKDPAGIYKGKFFYRDIEIEREIKK